MTVASAKSQPGILWLALLCALAGGAVFHWAGNATRGYVDTPSMGWWWISQWLDPQAETEHGWLILGIGGWLFWRNVRGPAGREISNEKERRAEGRARLTGADEDEARRGNSSFAVRHSALAAMVTGLGLNALGFVAQQTRISIVGGLVFAWGAVALADRRWARAAAFPLGFLVFAIPLNVLDSLGFWLRLGVIHAGAALAQGAGVDVVRSGTQLFAPDGRYQYDVAAACSGVRSLMALAALSLLIGYLKVRGWGRRALLLGLCLPLTYGGNVVRILAIVGAAELGGQRWGERAHDVMGFGVFAIVLGGVLGAAEALRRWWPEREIANEAWRRTTEGRLQPSMDLRQASFTAVAVVALAAMEVVFLGHIAAGGGRGAAGVRLSADGRAPAELPAFVGTEWIGRRVEVSAVEREILPADTGFSRRHYVSVAGGGHAVFVSVVLSGRDRTSIHRPELCLVGQGWTIETAERAALAWPGRAGAALPVTWLHATRTEVGGKPVRAAIAYWFVSSEGVVAGHFERAVRDLWARVRHGRADRWAYVLAMTDTGGGAAAARGRLQAVLEGTLPGLLEPGLKAGR